MLPSDMNLRIGRVHGTNLKINLDGEKDKPDVKSKEVEMVKTEPDVKPKVKTEPNIEPNKNTSKMLNLTSSSIEKANTI